VDRVRALLPRLAPHIPASISLDVYMDRTPTIAPRARTSSGRW